MTRSAASRTEDCGATGGADGKEAKVGGTLDGQVEGWGGGQEEAVQLKSLWDPNKRLKKLHNIEAIREYVNTWSIRILGALVWNCRMQPRSLWDPNERCLSIRYTRQKPL
uniref:Uncharacterized protein n=1 Tax=Steinernema glaseri TaxID=37863 RepID=A0A1I7ZK12_9BILA